MLLSCSVLGRNHETPGFAAAGMESERTTCSSGLQCLDLIDCYTNFLDQGVLGFKW